MKIIADKDIPLVEKYFSTAGDVLKLDGRQFTADEVKQADALIVRSITAIDRKLLHGSKVRYVATITSGIDHVDVNYLNENGIGFCSAAGCNARSVAEYVLSSLCVLTDQYGIDLTGKTAAIIGCGHIGSIVQRFFRTMGLECLVYDPPLQDATGDDQYCELEDVYSADVITLHVPLVMRGDYPTWRMVDAKFLGQLKQDITLINTSRGDVVDERALMEYLDGSDNARTVLDVWQGEPDIDTGLLARVNIGTAHIAGYSLDSKYRAVDTVCRQVCDYFNIEHDIDLIKNILDTGVSEISLTDCPTVQDAVRMAVLASYDVRTDASALRQVLETGPQGRGAYFDELRRDYRMRREFDALQVNLSPASAPLAKDLVDLGFRASVNQ